MRTRRRRTQRVWASPGSVPRWLPWPFPWQPRLQFGGPARSRDGRLWLIGHDGADYSFRELGTEGVAQVMPIEGARLGFGTLLFRRGHQVKDDPWAVEDVEDQTRGDALVLPLLDLLGKGGPQGMEGRTLLPLMTGGRFDDDASTSNTLPVLA